MAGCTRCASALDGVITGKGMYADLMARIWDAARARSADEAARRLQQVPADAQSEERIPGTGLYVMKKRGVFKTTVRRTTAPAPGAPAKLTEFKPSPMELEEIDTASRR